jgi:hypothetical protein
MRIRLFRFRTPDGDVRLRADGIVNAWLAFKARFGDNYSPAEVRIIVRNRRIAS